MFDGKKILITGGTGSLGTALTKRLLETNADTIRIYSRDELKQVQMQSTFQDKRLRFLIGDIRDKERLSRALENIDIVIHAAAMKQVPVVEYNPFEAIKTNVYGAQNLIDVCLEKNVEFALAVGTDKAVSPLNTYGATKLLMEKLFISANYYKGNHKIKFSCVRYGNVLGSRGSIVPLLISQIQSGKKITITDPTMTRFNITMDQSLDLIFRAIKNGIGGEVFIPKLKAYRLGDMKDALIDLLKGKNEIEKIPVRPGEKYHESLISKDEIRNAFET
ncbi:MAG: SDR family NAD(P)-dependent oxidoreductase, partial [Thaumarchaeota archaeon]